MKAKTDRAANFWSFCADILINVLETLLILAGRNELLTAKKLVDAKRKLKEILTLIDQLE